MVNAGLIERRKGLMRNFRVGQIITLMGKTKHGKNRIKEHGEKWEIRKININKLFLHSLIDDDIRWIERDFDKDFDIL